MLLFEQGSLAVRRLMDEDAELLVKWLSDVKVLEYYEGRDHPHDLKMVREHFYEKVEEVTCCIILYDGLPIGYVQYYPISPEEHESYEYPRDQHIYGMDQFIGEVDYWNRGLGTEMVKAMIQHLLQTERVDLIVMDPQAWNHRAIRVYEKCGFHKKKLLLKHEWHEGKYRDCWLMEYKP